MESLKRAFGDGLPELRLARIQYPTAVLFNGIAGAIWGFLDNSLRMGLFIFIVGSLFALLIPSPPQDRWFVRLAKAFTTGGFWVGMMLVGHNRGWY